MLVCVVVKKASVLGGMAALVHIDVGAKMIHVKAVRTRADYHSGARVYCPVCYACVLSVVARAEGMMLATRCRKCKAWLSISDEPWSSENIKDKE